MREGRPVVEWREGRGYDTSSTRVNSGNHVPARASVDASSVCGIDVTPVCVCVCVCVGRCMANGCLSFGVVIIFITLSGF